MRNRGIEFYSDNKDIVWRWFLHEYAALVDHIEVLERLWLLRVPYCAQVV